MDEKQRQRCPEREFHFPGWRERLVLVEPPEQAVEITLDAAEADQACFRHRLARRVGYEAIEELSGESIRGLGGHPCYRLPPGAETQLVIAFKRGGEPISPEGELRIETTRGKLYRQRVPLDGKESRVVVRYVAPDETIKVSIRAFLAGFQRGKVHLHLEM